MDDRPSPEMQQILDRLAQLYAHEGDLTLLPPAVGRAKAAERSLLWNNDLPEVETQVLTLIGAEGQPMEARLYLPTNARGTILHLHGGGFAFGSLDGYELASRLLALDCSMAVVTPDYRLAPEHPYPAGLNDCRAVYAQILAGEIGANGPVVVAGDSAGANLALALILAEHAEASPLPAAGLLFYGVFDADFGTPSYQAFADGPGLTRDRMRRYWDWYAPVEQRASPLLSPLRAEDAALADLPPLLITAAAIDPLRSEAEAMFARLSALGRKDRFHFHPGVTHGFMGMARDLTEGRAAFSIAAEALEQFLDHA